MKKYSKFLISGISVVIFMLFLGINVRADTKTVSTSSNLISALQDSSTNEINIDGDINVSDTGLSKGTGGYKYIQLGDKDLTINGNKHQIKFNNIYIQSSNQNTLNFNDLVLYNSTTYSNNYTSSGFANDSAQRGLIQFSANNNSEINFDNINFYGGTLFSVRNDSDVNSTFSGIGELSSIFYGNMKNTGNSPNIVANDVTFTKESSYNMVTLSGNCIHLDSSKKTNVTLDESAYLNLNPNTYGSSSDYAGDFDLSSGYAGIFFASNSRLNPSIQPESNIIGKKNSKLNINCTKSENPSRAIPKDPDSFLLDNNISNGIAYTSQAVYSNPYIIDYLPNARTNIDLNQAEFIVSADSSSKYRNNTSGSIMRNYSSYINFNEKNESKININIEDRNFSKGAIYTKGIGFNVDNLSSYILKNSSNSSNYLFTVANGGQKNVAGDLNIKNPSYFELTTGVNGKMYSTDTGLPLSVNIFDDGYIYASDINNNSSGNQIFKSNKYNENYDESTNKKNSFGFNINTSSIIDSIRNVNNQNNLSDSLTKVNGVLKLLKITRPIVTLYYVDNHNNILKKQEITDEIGKLYTDNPTISEAVNNPESFDGYTYQNYTWNGNENNIKDGKFGLNNDEIVFHYKRNEKPVGSLNPTFQPLYFKSEAFKNSILYPSVTSKDIQGIKFNDTRNPKTPINVSLKQTDSNFKNNSGDSIQGELFYKDGSDSTPKSILNNNTQILSGYTVPDSDEFDWTKDRQILFKPISVKAIPGKDYSSELSWTVTTGLQ